MLKYLSKFFLEILPSVVATVVGAYIVNHYISPRNPLAEAPRAAAISQPAIPDDTAKVDAPKPDVAKAVPTPVPAPVREARPDPKPDSKSKAVAKVQPEPKPEAKPELKTETAKSDAPKGELGIRRFITRDKAPERAPQEAPAETAAVTPPEDHPDAAELARAALERLRAAEPASRPADASASGGVVAAPREPAREPPHVAVVTAMPQAPSATASVSAAPMDSHTAVPPLPPPVSVAAPVERPGLPAADTPRMASRNEADRLVPPAEIPGPPPVDLQPAPKKKSVAEDMLSAARSVFQSVVPQ